jgi:shikimate dehydrogenase/3-dehydroquinate dehydratase type I
MRLFVTILEGSQERAVDAIGGITDDHDGVEVRAERFASFDPDVIRKATAKPIILTFRGKRPEPDARRRALVAGIDFVDIEYEPGVVVDDPSRTVLSLHDFKGVPDLARVVPEMRALGCAHAKIAATPQNFAANRAMLDVVAPGMTVIGMGERGMYARILAPFLGSELMFVSPSDEKSAAPGQITLRRALDIYGPNRAALRGDRVFCVVGNPAGHSLSPSIHNGFFRKKGVPAAYTIASVESFSEMEDAFEAGNPCGLSVTAPFKEDAFAFAQRIGATIGENARQSGAVNTLVRLATGTVADNTDVDAFNSILAQLCGRDRKSVALAGAGGTARAALVALNRAGMHTTVYNRTEEKAKSIAAQTAPLDELRAFDGEIVINTTPNPEIEIPVRAGMTYIASAYGDAAIEARHAALRDSGIQVFDGQDLLQLQAVRQHQLFMRVFDESR